MHSANRRSRALCGVGEIGEIYVRAGGLAAGYLGLASTSEEKFVANFLAASGAPNQLGPDPTDESGVPLAPPMWLGCRDRMYRTGDLGRYTPTGDVECTGRVDDQVKVRGFRVSSARSTRT